MIQFSQQRLVMEPSSFGWIQPAEKCLKTKEKDLETVTSETVKRLREKVQRVAQLRRKTDKTRFFMDDKFTRALSTPLDKTAQFFSLY